MYMYTWYIFRSALKELEDKDSRLEAAEQATSASKLEAAAAQRKCEDTRRSGDIRLADLQLEAARQLSVLRSKNDSLGRENDQLRVASVRTASDMAASAADRSRLEQELIAANRGRLEATQAAEMRLSELEATLRSLEANNRELEAAGREAGKLRQAAVMEVEEAVRRLEEENGRLRREQRLIKQDVKGILEERDQLLDEARDREELLLRSLKVK